MKKIIIVIPILAVIIGIGAVFASETFLNLQTNENEKSTVNLQEKSYKYNTICDIDDLEIFMLEEVWRTTMSITNGDYNDDPRVMEFFKNNEFLSDLKLTPEKMLTMELDHTMRDVMFWMPLTLEILDASPQVVNILSYDEEKEDQTPYENRILAEFNKCK